MCYLIIITVNITYVKRNEEFYTPEIASLQLQENVIKYKREIQNGEFYGNTSQKDERKLVL